MIGQPSFFPGLPGRSPLRSMTTQPGTKNRLTEVHVRRLKADLEKEIVERTHQLKTTRQRLDKRQRELRSLRDQYRLLVEQLPTITYVKSPDDNGTVVYVSPQVERLLGFTPTEWMSDPRRWLEQLVPEDRETVLAEYPHLLHNGGRFHAEYRLRARDGRTVWVRDDATLVRDDFGQPLFIQGVLSDISDQKRAERLASLSDRFGAR